MGGSIWTKEQLRAINIGGCDLLVAAAAGSGKTAVLVERILTIITNEEQPVDIDNLLVVTFTNAAATEMRDRIGKALLKKAEEQPNNEHLKKQLTLLLKAKITTIHSFCLDVIRENYNIVDIDPAFKVADETEIALIKSEVLDMVLEEYYTNEENEGFLSLVESFSENTGDTRLRALIFNVYNFIQSSPFPLKWLDEMVERFNINDDISLDSTCWGEFVYQDAMLDIKGLIDITKLSMDIINMVDGPKEYGNSILEDYHSLMELTYSKNLEQLYNQINSVKFATIGRKKKDGNPELQLQVSYLRETVKDGLKSIKEKFFFKEPGNMKYDLKMTYPVLKSLSEIVKVFSERFLAVKKEKLLVDFDDQQHYCLQILLDDGSTEHTPIPSKVAVDMQNRFYEIMIDEYQDSNSVQEMLLSVISKNSQGKYNRFMVGDVKQSIYRFRLANPQLFMEKYETYSVDDKGSQVRIDLFKNFRSRKEILDGVNFLFKQLMSKDLGEIVYDDKASLNHGAVFEEVSEGQALEPEICIDIINYKNEHPNQEIEGVAEELSKMQLEANLIASRILELLDRKKNYHAMDKKTGKYRPVEYRDIVIILRSHKSFKGIFESELGKAGIPVYMDVGDNYFENTEVMVMLSLLQIIDNLRQDIPLISVLYSPIGNMSANELMEIKLAGDNNDSFYDCMLKFISEKIEDDNIIKNKINTLFEKIKNWRKLVILTPLNEFIWLIYNETGYFDYAGVTIGGELRQANLKFLVEQAEKFEKSSYTGLFNFVRYMESVKESNLEISGAKIISENDNIIRVMSIHKSKGLEFPIVFVSGLGKRFNKEDTKGDIILHQNLGFGPNYVDYEKRVTYNTVAKAALSKKIEKENLSEEMRVLYVALTRAKEKLILTGGINNLEKSLMKWQMFINSKDIELPAYNMQKASCYLDWIMPAVMRHKDSNYSVGQVGNIEVFKDESKWKINILSREECINTVKIDSIETKESKNSIDDWDADNDYSGYKEEVHRRLSYKYAYEEETKLPSNVSISELKRIYNKERFVENEPLNNFELSEIKNSYGLDGFVSYLNKEKDISSSRKGTVIHALMEILNFKKIYSDTDIKNEIQGLINKRIINEKEADLIDVEKIIKFLDSNIGQRLKVAEKIFKEQSFAIEMEPLEVYGEQYKKIKEQILIHGIIDCFFYEQEEIVLVDYKTDYVQKGEEEDFKKKYEIQMNIYKKAIESVMGARVKESFIYSFWMDKEISI